MPPVMPPGMGMQADPSMMAPGGSQFSQQDLENVARPTYEDEDLEVVSALKEMAGMTKGLIQKVKSGPVEDVLVAILSKLTSLQKKFDSMMEEEE